MALSRRCHFYYVCPFFILDSLIHETYCIGRSKHQLRVLPGPWVKATWRSYLSHPPSMIFTESLYFISLRLADRWLDVWGMRMTCLWLCPHIYLFLNLSHFKKMRDLRTVLLILPPRCFFMSVWVHVSCTIKHSHCRITKITIWLYPWLDDARISL